MPEYVKWSGIIGIEGIVSISGRLIVPGSTDIPEETIPLLAGFDSSSPIGTVDVIRTEVAPSKSYVYIHGEGTIRQDILDSFLDMEIPLAMSTDMVEMEEDCVITHSRLRAVSVCIAADWPDARIVTVETE